ncbi:MAG: Gldg family protein [Myxococcales bacterium]|nr:Gldg family protein [Myxococcales bacterium]
MSAARPPALLAPGLTAAGLLALLLGERAFGAPAISYVGVGAVAMATALRARRGPRALGAAHLALLGALALYGLSTEPGLDLLRLPPGHLLERALDVLWPATTTLAILALSTGERLAFVLRAVADADAAVGPRVRDACLRGLAIGLGLVFVVSVNVAASARDRRVDLSFLRVTEPSETTLALVAAQQDEVRAVLLYPDAHEVGARVRPYLEALAAHAPGRFSVQQLDHALVPELAARLRITGNGYVALLLGDEEAMRSETLELGLELAPARSRLRTLDGRFQEAFARLTQPRREVALTVGHGERSHGGAEIDPAERLGRFVTELRRANIEITTLGIAEGLAREVPRDTRMIALIGPREPLAPEETEALLAYVREGGRLLVTVDHEAGGGADALLAGLGLQLLPGTLASEESMVARSRTKADRARVFAARFSDHPLVVAARRDATRSAVVLERGAALAPLDPTPEGATVVFPLRTREDVWRDLDGDLERGPDEALEAQRVLAAVVLRAAGAREGRAVVVPDGSFAGDDLLGYRGNLLVLGDALRWLLGDARDGRPAIVGVTTSEEDVPVEHAPADERLYFWLGSLGVPLPLMVFGLVSALRRRRARREEA